MSGAESFAVKHLTAGGVMIKINNIWQTGKISKICYNERKYHGLHFWMCKVPVLDRGRH